MLITSEELNEYNTFHSSFELAQAVALQKKNVRVGIISVGSVTVKAVARNFIYRLSGRKDGDHRLNHYSYLGLFRIGLVTAYRALLGIKKVRKITVNKIPVYESLITRFGDFYINHRHYREFIRYGLKAIRIYIKQNGKPRLIQAHSRFLLAGLLAREIKDRYGIPYIVTEHSSYYVRENLNPVEVNQVVDTINNASMLTTVSRKLGEWINSSIKKQYSFNITPNIIDSIFEEELPLVNANKRPFTYLIVASLNENKGHRLLLKAFSGVKKQIDNVCLKIAGDGQEFSHLKELALKLGVVDYVKFMGHLSLEQVRKEMINSDCLVVASEFETFGVVVIEALACGKPVISTRCGGPEELIHEKNGVLVPVNDQEALSAAMIRMYNDYPNYIQEDIRRDCINQFGQEAIASNLIEKYQLILSNSDNHH